MPQIQDVAPGQLPEAAHGGPLHRSGQCRGKQVGRVVNRKWLQIKPVELRVLPEFLYANGNRLPLTDREHQFGGPALHRLLQHEDRQVVEQVRVIDAEDDGCRRRHRCQRIDHAAHQMQAVGFGVTGPGGQRTQREPTRGGAADDPPNFAAVEGRRIECFTGHPTLADAGRTGDHNAGGGWIGD